MDWDRSADIATTVGIVLAFLTLIKGLVEYSRQSRQQRAGTFNTMRAKLKSNDTFKELCDLIEIDDPHLRSISLKEERDFPGLFEEVALMLDSGLVRKEVAHYMFGYYAIRCMDSDNFWMDVNRNSLYWQAFRDFVEQMKEQEKSFTHSRKRFKF